MAITATTRSPQLADPAMPVTCLISEKTTERPFTITVQETASFL